MEWNAYGIAKPFGAGFLFRAINYRDILYGGWDVS